MTTRNLSPGACYRETNHFHYEESDEGTVFGEVFTHRPSTDILCCPEERGDIEELIKAGHYTCYLGEQHC